MKFLINMRASVPASIYHGFGHIFAIGILEIILKYLGGAGKHDIEFKCHFRPLNRWSPCMKVDYYVHLGFNPGK